jgi:hypothetical protein
MGWTRSTKVLLLGTLGMLGATACYEHNVGSPGGGPDGASGLPPNACVYGDQNRAGCAGARIIGRGLAAMNWHSGQQENCGAHNDTFNECSPHSDQGYDHTYAIFVRAGESVSVSLAAVTGECGAGESFGSRLKIKTNVDATEGGAASCPVLFGCWLGPSAGEEWSVDQYYSPEQDEWVFIIVDGGDETANEHRGYYTLAVTLTECADPNCGC